RVGSGGGGLGGTAGRRRGRGRARGIGPERPAAPLDLAGAVDRPGGRGPATPSKGTLAERDRGAALRLPVDRSQPRAPRLREDVCSHEGRDRALRDGERPDPRVTVRNHLNGG